MPRGSPEAGLRFKRAAGDSLIYRNALRSLSTATAAALAALTADVDDEDEFVAVGAATLGTANEEAAGLSDLYLATLLDVAVIGLSARDTDAGRLENALRIAVDPEQGIDPAAQLDRLARAEPLRAGQHALTDGMLEHRVPGWTRVAGGDPCTVCATFADGEVRPPTVDMYVHPGCSCVAQPVTS